MRDPDHLNFSDVLIGDFGISSFLTQDRTFLKTKAGSYGYIASEVLMENGYSKPCDIWSIGIITYVLLTGMSPYNGESFEAELTDILDHQLTYDEPFWSNISRDAKDFTKSCLKLSPHLRQTAEDALQHPWLSKHHKERNQISTKSPKVSEKAPEKKLSSGSNLSVESFTPLLPIPAVSLIQNQKSQKSLLTPVPSSSSFAASGSKSAQRSCTPAPSKSDVLNQEYNLWPRIKPKLHRHKAQKDKKLIDEEVKECANLMLRSKSFENLADISQ
jgi:serine/threonine protein kinase